jgi:hypothetical protein
MMMDHETILKRKAELTAQREQLIGNVNALAGAIQDCDFWLEQLAGEGQPSPSPIEGSEDGDDGSQCS